MEVKKLDFLSPLSKKFRAVVFGTLIALIAPAATFASIYCEAEETGDGIARTVAFNAELSGAASGVVSITGLQMCSPLFGCLPEENWRIIEVGSWDGMVTIALRKREDGNQSNWRWFRIDPIPNTSGEHSLRIDGSPFSRGEDDGDPFIGSCRPS